MITLIMNFKKKNINLDILKYGGAQLKLEFQIIKRKKIDPKTIDSIFIGYALIAMQVDFL